MQTIRNLNIVILAFLLILTGCFGLADDAVTEDAEGQTTSTNDATTNEINHAPFITGSDLFNSPDYSFIDSNITYDSITGEAIVNGYTFSLYHAVVDIDSDNLTMGWDINLDGNIDIATIEYTGFTDVYVPLAEFSSLNLNIDLMYTNIAFIAIDEHGFGNVMFVELFGGDGSDSNWGNNLYLYSFSGADAPGNDGAVIMTMDQGSDLGWASITIKASVDGAASSTVPACDGAVTEDCWSSTDADTASWNSGEAITVDTSCVDACTVTINVLNSREGTTLDTTIVDVE